MIRLRTIRIGLLLLSAALLAGACSTPAKTTWLMDLDYGTDYPAPPAPELVIQADDVLGIQVSSETPQLAQPFSLSQNLPSGDRAGRDNLYLVDRDGNIEFPLLGFIPVAGKTLKEVKDHIAGEIRDKGYIKNPIVIVTLENFSVTVVGNVGNRVLPVKGNSINLLEVLANAGGITDNSKIKDVMVVRTENGQRTAYSVNLQKKDLFESPVFYLKQNDVVYVKPQGTRLNASGQTVMTFVSSALSLANIIAYLLIWTR